MIYLLGDVHGNFEHVLELVERDRPAAIIFLGDLECQQPLHELVAPIRDLADIWWIPGNHDTDSVENYQNLFGSELADRNLSGRVVEIAGVRVAGLGGIFRGEIWSPPAEPNYANYDAYVKKAKGGRDLEGRLRRHWTSIFPSDVAALSGKRADILVTHEAPSCHQHGWAIIDRIAQAARVSAVFHGHHHDNPDYRQFDAALGFRTYGVGFCGVTDDAGNVVESGDFDDMRW